MKDFSIAMSLVSFTLLLSMPFMKQDVQDGILELPQPTRHEKQEKIIIDNTFAEPEKFPDGYFAKDLALRLKDIAVLMAGFYLGRNIVKIRKHPNYKRDNVVSIPMT